MRVGSYVNIPLNRNVSVPVGAYGIGNATALFTAEYIAAAFNAFVQTDEGEQELLSAVGGEENLDPNRIRDNFEIVEITVTPSAELCDYCNAYVCVCIECNFCASGNSRILGDIDGDGRITSADTVFLARHLLSPTAQLCFYSTNFFGDNRPVTVAHLVILARRLVGHDVTI
jgi:hypothetical protein